MDSFDPYQQWLGIPTQLRPLNHYILLGVKIYENNPERIALGYEARMELLKQFQSGPRGDVSQKLISQVAKAKRDLLDPDRRAKYDSALKKQLEVKQLQSDQAQDETLAAQSSRGTQDLPAQSPEGFSVAAGVGNSDFPYLKEQAVQAQTSLASRDTATGYQDDADDLDEAMLSPFWFLKDVRYLVGLLALSVLVMTATVKLLVPKQKPVDQTSPVLPASPEPAQEHLQVDPSVASPSATNAMPPKIQQAADGTFELALARADLKGDLKSGLQGISNWSLRDQAAWTLEVSDPRTGFFNCKVTYRAKSECGFEVQLGDREPRRFTLYPHEEDFEEEFIVRLNKIGPTSNRQTFRLKANTSATGVEIKRILLVPNR